MKVRYIGKQYENFIVEHNRIDLIPGKEYEVIKIVQKPTGWYRLIDESGEDYMYPPELFKIVEEQEINRTKILSDNTLSGATTRKQPRGENDEQE